MFVAFGQQRATIQMLFVVGWVSDGMEMTTDYSLWLVRFGPNHGVQSLVAFADVSVAAEEIYRAGAEP